MGSLSLCAPRKDLREWKQEEDSNQEPSHAGTLVSDFQPQNCEK